MTEPRLRAIFELANIPVLRTWALVDGYGYPVSSPDFFKTPPRLVWWLVKTPFGLVQIGWRKRVIEIDWSETALRTLVTVDDVTKSESMVHAWSETKAIEYLASLQAGVSMVAAATSCAKCTGHMSDMALCPVHGAAFTAHYQGIEP